MKYFNTLIDTVKNFDKKTSIIMHIGFKLSFILCLISIYILLAYHLANIPNMYYIGISLFKMSLSFGVTFFICGLGFNTIKKDIS